MRFRHIQLLAILVAIGNLLVSCGEYYDAPIVEVSASGYIYAGESGGRVKFSDFPVSYGGGQPNADPLEILSETGAEEQSGIRFYIFSDAHLFYSYQNISILGTDSIVEFVHESKLDTVNTCYDVNADTTAGHITHSNVLTNADCGGQLYLEQVVTVTSPKAFSLGDRIDSTLTWGSYGSEFTSSSWYHEVIGDLMVDHTTEHPLWLDGSGRRFVAFRIRENGRFRYGYLEVNVFQDHIMVNSVAVER